MTDNSTPEQKSNQLLNPHELTDLSVSSAITNPEIIASALGGIGLGDTKDRGLNYNQDKQDEETTSVEEYSAIIENINSQVAGSYGGYVEGMESMEKDSVDGNQFLNTLKHRIKDWSLNGTLAYVREQTEADRELKFELVSVPDEVLSSEDIFSLIYGFSETGGATISRGVIDQGGSRFDGGELCGRPDSVFPVRFLLIPNKFTLPAASPMAQNHRFDSMRRSIGAPIFTPSPMEAVFWWYTKRRHQRIAQNNSSAQLDTEFLDTYTCHLDLKSAKSVVESYIGQTSPTLRTTISSLGARIAVGARTRSPIHG